MSSEPNITVRSESDLDLVKRAQEGDSDAFASLFYAHKTRIYSVCLRMTNNTAEAEDLSQDAFLQVFRKLATFHGDSALSTWLYRIAVNTVLMHFRKKALRQISLDEPMSQDAKLVKREYGSKDNRLVGSVDRIALSRAIKELPDGYRTIFLLHEVEGYEHQEIAQLLDCSVGNSKSQLHKAKLRIRELLGQAQLESDRVSTVKARGKRITVKPVAAEVWEVPASESLPVPPTMVPAMAHFAASNA
ncbi:MAG: sigma-70 family RNA polymerase sigma factor [Acidobacteriota bacterium]|nr:sigma-70 family RNA polymerase sigma factor [Acidobacteriota bacterium]